MTKEEEAIFKKGYERCRLDAIRELEQLIAFYYKNGKTNGGDALCHIRTVLRSVQPGQKPWDIDL